VFQKVSNKVYASAAGKVGMDAAVTEKVWDEHMRGGTGMGDDLIDFLDVEEEGTST